MNIWFTSDLHFGLDTKRCAIMQRPENYAATLFDFWNQNVKSNDLVIVVGDVCDQGSAENLWLLEGLPGLKWLCRGNHDQKITDEQFAPYFEHVYPENEVLLTESNGVPIAINHYPHFGVADRFNICGHIHSAWKYQKNMLNVAIDVHHFNLMNAEQIPFYLTAVTKFYDKDVWVAQHAANMAHNSDRGKPGYYYNEPSRLIKVDMQG